MTNPRSHAIEIWNAGVDSVRAGPLLAREVLVDGDQLQIGNFLGLRTDFDRIIVVGAGKANTAMAIGLLDRVGDWLPVTGWINVPSGTEQELPGIHIHAARPAGQNEPTTEGVAGTKQILKLVQNAGPRDLCIAMISGGGSALLPAPVDGISLEDKRLVTRSVVPGQTSLN